MAGVNKTFYVRKSSSFEESWKSLKPLALTFLSCVPIKSFFVQTSGRRVSLRKYRYGKKGELYYVYYVTSPQLTLKFLFLFKYTIPAHAEARFSIYRGEKAEREIFPRGPAEVIYQFFSFCKYRAHANPFRFDPQKIKTKQKKEERKLSLAVIGMKVS